MSICDSAWEQQLKISASRNFSNATVFDILSRLPVKSILRFKSVCKKWDALFGDSQFIDAHLHRSVGGSDRCYLLQQRVYEEKMGTLRTVFSLTNEENFEELRELHCNPELSHGCEIVASINGIACFMTNGVYLSILDILLWNPATRESRFLPRSPCERSATCVGFGFDPKNNDYKVVAIFQSEDPFEVKVYSLKADSWRVIEANSYELQLKLPVVYVNGRMHWFGSVNYNKLIVVSFDVADIED